MLALYFICCHSLKAVIRHIGIMKCGIQGCVRTYKNYTSFKKHVYRHHKEQLDPVDPESIKDSALDLTMPPDSLCEDDGVNIFGPDSSDAGYDYTEQAALFILKAKHVHKVSQAALNELLSDVSMMISDRVHYVESKVRHHLQEFSSVSVLETFHHPAVIDLYAGLKTRYL